MNNIVSYKAPKLRPLPTDITDAVIRDATLPPKIEDARRAIARCTDLSELLHYQEQAQGLAAAVKVMKNVAPEMVRSANQMCKEAIIRLGEILLTYSNGRIFTSIPPTKVEIRAPGGNGTMLQTRNIKRLKGDRRNVADAHGISLHVQTMATRIAEAPAELRAAVLSDVDIAPTIKAMSSALPSRQGTGTSGVHHSDAVRFISRGKGASGAAGLNGAKTCLGHVPLEAFASLSIEERKFIKTKITEIMELLDKMDQLCGP